LETVEQGGVLENITKVLALIAVTGSALPTIGWAAPADAAHKAVPAAVAIPRVNGHPNFSGVWQVLNTANWDIEPHLARAALELRPGPVVPVPAKAIVALGAVGSVPAGMGVVVGGHIPYTAEALAKKQENQQHYLERDPEVKCDLPGIPRANYMPFPFQIVQSGKSILFSYEYDGAVRDILFDDPGPAPIDSWMGQSVGKWDGDTLTVTVTGLNDSTWFDRAGNFHSADMKVVEHWTLTSADRLHYEAEISDPATFSQPWKMSMVMYRRLGDDARLQQFKCVEFVEELMYGDLRKEPLK
jgi:hypothetical protein